MPCPFGSLRLRWPRFQFCSFRLLSQLRHSSGMPIWANRFSAAPSRYISSPSRSNPLPFDANQIRADHLRCKSGLRTSNPCQFSTACADQCRACSLPFRSIRHSTVSSLLFVHPVEASQSHRSSLVRQSDLSCSPPFRFVGIRRAAFPFHFAVTQGCALPWHGRSALIRIIASPYDSDTAAQRRCHAIRVWSNPCPCGSALLICAYT